MDSKNILENILHDAVAYVRAKESLLPIFRKKIYDYLSSVDNIGNLRAYLDYVCLSKIIYIWNKHVDDDDTPNEILKLINNYFGDVINRNELKSLAQNYGKLLIDYLDSRAVYSDDDIVEPSDWEQLTPPDPQSESFAETPTFVLMAAVEALHSAAGLYGFDDYVLDESVSETELDLASADTAHWAMYAFAGDEQEEWSSSARRREFWEWWLLEAIPTALKTSQ